MATYTYQPLVDELLTEAWERCGNNPTALNGATAASARRSLQLMLLSWSAVGTNLWQIEKAATATVVGDPTIILDASTVDVVDVYLTDPYGNDLQLGSVPRESYLGMPRKDTPGMPTLYWPERSFPPVLHLFETPDKVYPLAIWRIRQPQDVATLGDRPDIPVLWSEAVASGLAARLAQKFVTDPQRRAELRTDADRAYSIARDSDDERSPFTLMPQISAY